MGFPSVVQKIFEHGFNSSHSVLALDDFLYFESSCGWIFAYMKSGSRIQVALEPVIPSYESRSDQDIQSEFDISWREFTDYAGSSEITFVSVGERFARILEQRKFRTLCIGREPWVDLRKSMPSGNSGRGVRSARNLAIRCGFTVREWSAGDLASDEEKRNTLLSLYRRWKNATTIQISGFILATDPLCPIPDRRWFVAMRGGIAEGYVVATRVGRTDRYYLEDLIYDRYASKGIAELLVTESFSALEKSGFRKGSLGFVLGLSAADLKANGLSCAARLAYRIISRIMPLFYNCRGQETFRKRFKPSWENCYLALSPCENGIGAARILSLFASVISSFKVGISLSAASIAFKIRNVFFRYAITGSTCAAMLLFFIFVNKGGNLPQWAYTRFDFAFSLPLQSGIFRNLVGNFLYETPCRFALVFAMLLFFGIHAERRWKKRYLIMLLAPCILVDNYISYFLIYSHFEKINPLLYSHITNAPFFGIEHYIAGLSGMIVWEFRKRRDILISALNMLILLFILWHARSVSGFVLDLSIMIFFTLGTIIGRSRYFFIAMKNRRSAKWKTPTMS